MSTRLEHLLSEKSGLRVIPGREINLEGYPEFLDSERTPHHAFFVRNNGTLPDISADDIENWRLTIDGEVEQPLSLSLTDLRQRFPVVAVEAVLECAGNGRSRFLPPTEGLQWNMGAVACALWTGVRLADVLKAAKLRPSAVYVGFESPDCCLDDASRQALSRGVPIDKALSDETLIAFEMNGGPLPPLHGAPLRIVAPGYPGSAWQKWLRRVWVRDREHDGAKMTGLDYRLPASQLGPQESYDATQFQVITDLRVKSLITSPAEGDDWPVGESIKVRGFAWSGHIPVESVRVSADGGLSWLQADLAPTKSRFGWRRFEVELPRPEGSFVELVAQARDAAGNAQPLASAPWNPRGYLNNQAQRLKLAPPG